MNPFQELRAIPLFAVSALETVINETLKFDPYTLEQIAALEGKVIALQVTGLDIELFMIPTTEGLRLQTMLEGEPDVRIKGGPIGLARMGLEEKPGTLFGQGIEIEGDVHLGRRIKAILNDIDIDWEEQLSRLVGDVAAHQVGNTLRGLGQWGRKAAETLSMNVAEFFQEESRDIVGHDELNRFLDGVDKLRMDADRLEARIKRLLDKPEDK